jgi:hypothetical protein
MILVLKKLRPMVWDDSLQLFFACGSNILLPEATAERMIELMALQEAMPLPAAGTAPKLLELSGNQFVNFF